MENQSTHDYNYTLEDLRSALRAQRVRPLYGVSEDEQAWIRKVWFTLTQIETISELSRWTASVRQALFGSSEMWAKAAFELDPAIAQSGHRKGRFLLGPAVMQWVLDDAWLDDPKTLMQLSKYSSLDTPWSQDDLATIAEKSQDLAEKFGLCHLRINAGESPQRTLQLLDEASIGLMNFAEVIGFSPLEVGAHRIGLSWGLAHHPEAGAHFDPLTSSINLQEAGSFAHEWSHALDLSIGQAWDGRATGKQKYASHQAHVSADSRSRWAPAPEVGSLEEMQLSIAERDELPSSHRASIQVARTVLEQLSQVLEIVARDVPYPQWQERAERRINAYRKWVDLATSSEPNLELIQSRWESWKQGCEVAWSDPDSDEGKQWERRWFRMINVATRISFAALPKQTAWVSWAKAKDAEDDHAYWAEPHELWARSFHAWVFGMEGQSSWAASNASDPDQFPQGQEQIALMAWWSKWLPEWKKTWTASLQTIPVVQKTNLVKLDIPVTSQKSKDEDDGMIACWKARRKG